LLPALPSAWPTGDLLSRPKSDPAKLAIAIRLRKETTLSIKAIAARLVLGTSKSANSRFHAAMSQTSWPDPIQHRLGL
jgi:hypothetical protein